MYFNLKITRTGAQMSKYTLLQTTQYILPVKGRCYPDSDYHRVYYGEIVAVYANESYTYSHRESE